MIKLFKRLAILFSVFIGVLFLAIIAVYIVSVMRMNKTYSIKSESIKIPKNQEAIMRGKHLSIAIGKCQSCHGDNLAGKKIINNLWLGKIVGTNLTTGQGGLSSRSDKELVLAVRYGIRLDGKPLIFMPSHDLWHLSDEDLGSIIAYMKSVPPVDNKLSKGSIGLLGRTLYLLGKLKWVSAEEINHNAKPPSSLKPSLTKAYGKYLAHTGGCIRCHNQDLSGIKKDHLFKALRQGISKDGNKIRQPMPWKYAGKMTDEEIEAIWLYLKK